jgi:hypothetical protein
VLGAPRTFGLGHVSELPVETVEERFPAGRSSG